MKRVKPYYYSKQDIHSYRTESDRMRRAVQDAAKSDHDEAVSTMHSYLLEHYHGAIGVGQINQSFVEHLFSNKMIDHARVALFSTAISAGRGFAERKDLLHWGSIYLNIGYKKMLQIEEYFLSQNWWEYDYTHDVLRIKSWTRIPSSLGINSRLNIKVPIIFLTDRKTFISHVVCLTHLKLQNRFRYVYPKLRVDFDGYEKTHGKSHPLCRMIDKNAQPEKVEKVGCSIRKVAADLQLSYRFCQQALKGGIKRCANEVDKVTFDEFANKYDPELFVKEPKYSYRRIGNKISVRYALGSLNAYDFDYMLCRGKRIRSMDSYMQKRSEVVPDLGTKTTLLDLI